MENMISKSQFKPRALHYFREVEKTGKELVISDHGKPVLKIVPYVEDPEEALKVSHSYSINAKAGDKVSILKFGGYVTDRNHQKNELTSIAHQCINKAETLGWYGMLKQQQQAWKAIWDMSDITIDGDLKAQQAIRYNIFYFY